VYGDFNNRLAASTWIAGDFYSIADIALYPWTAYIERHGFQASDFPHLEAWRRRIEERPAVQRAGKTLQEAGSADLLDPKPMTEEDINVLFNRSQAGPGIDFEKYIALGPMTRV
jgi:GST-like protein